MGAARLSEPGAAPLVSVIVATYNRSQPLRHAIQSVINSTFTDWELLVVGDACTDDTAECVAAFADARIRFINLPQRCGDQSGPNNHGVALARGRYVAFLNHDDYYLPDHLATSVSELESSGADLVWSAIITLTARSSRTPSDRPYGFRLTAVPATPGYSPTSFYFASCWVHRRNLVDRVGPWRAPRQIHYFPSQDWLFRAHRSGAQLRFIPRATVVVIAAARRPNCYANRESPEHEWLTGWVKEHPRYRESMLEEAALESETQRRSLLFFPSVRSTAWRLLRRLALAGLEVLGAHPGTAYNTLLRKRGDRLIREHRRKVGAD